MSLRNWFNEKIVLPSSDIFLGQRIAKDVKFLLESQWWSKEKIKSYQHDKLRSLINHSYHNVPYYQKLFDNLSLKPTDILTNEDLNKLPILTKAQIRKNIANGSIIAKNISLSEMVLSSSSGSTGEPLQFFVTKKSQSMNYASGIRGWYWMGYRLGDKYIKLSQNPRKAFKKKLQDFANNTLYLSSQQLTDPSFYSLVKKINKYRPQFIRGYPDPLFFLANYIKKHKINIHKPNAITTTGNILTKKARHIIEEQFGCFIFDAYSCEGGANVFECSTHECYHSSMEYAITEILDEGIEVGTGEKGRVITTDLHNYALPLLRYDSQDYVTKSINKCHCGRNLLEIAKIDGRDSDILVTPMGKYLIVHNFTGYFEWLDSVDRFQVLQAKIDEIKILLQVNNKYSQTVENQILLYWKDYIGESVKIEICVVDEIELSKSGKRRFLIRDKKILL